MSAKLGRQPLARHPDLDHYLAEHPVSASLLGHVRRLVAGVGPVTERTTRSQVAFRRVRPVAWAWAPGQYRRGSGAPLVLTIPFPARDPSQRWKEVVEVRPGHFMHHLELWSAEDLDEEAAAWLRAAWDAAGSDSRPSSRPATRRAAWRGG